MEPVDIAFDEINRLGMFIDLCFQGLTHTAHASWWVDILEKATKVLGKRSLYKNLETFEDAKRSAKKSEDFAREEIQHGFSYLFGLAAIKLWSILENLIDQLVLQYLKEPLIHQDKELISKIKGPVVEFIKASADEQAEFLAGELKNLVKSALSIGVGKFESILKPLGLGGGVPDEVRKAFVELVEVRNILVHRNGIVDKKFTKMCPWLSFELGDQIHLKPANFQIYKSTAIWYILELNARIEQCYGNDKSKEYIGVQNTALEIISNFYKSSSSLSNQEIKTEQICL